MTPLVMLALLFFAWCWAMQKLNSQLDQIHRHQQIYRRQQIHRRPSSRVNRSR